jgi:Flp pilus assembly protein TadD
MSKANITEKRRAVDAPESGSGGGQQTQPDSGTRRISVSKAMEQAHQLLTAGQLQPAAQLCSQIVSAQPRMAEAHNLMAAIRHAQGNSAAAVKSLQRAINLNENNAQFYSNLGEIERQRGKPREALVALRRAVSLDPNFAQAWSNLGIVHYDRRDFKEAIKCYEKAISLNDSYPEAHNNLANALRALGKNEEALDHYQRALLLRENYPEVYNNMASILRERGDVAEAEHAYRKAIGLKPHYLEAYNNLATLLVQHERSDEALRMLGRALEINATHVPTLITTARTQLKQGNHVQAEQACRLALKEDMNNAEAQEILGQVLDETDRFTEALESYETALTLRPELVEARNHYAICLKQVGRLDDARAQFLKTIELYPWAYGCYSNLADLEKFTPDNPHFLAMEAIIKKAENPKSDPYIRPSSTFRRGQASSGPS